MFDFSISSITSQFILHSIEMSGKFRIKPQSSFPYASWFPKKVSRTQLTIPMLINAYHYSILTRRLPGASFEQWTFEFLYKTLIHWATSLHPFLYFPNYICHFKMALYMRSKFITISYGNLYYHHMKIKKPVVNFIIKNIFDRKLM